MFGFLFIGDLGFAYNARQIAYIYVGIVKRKMRDGEQYAAGREAGRGRQKPADAGVRGCEFTEERFFASLRHALRDPGATELMRTEGHGATFIS